MQRGLAGFSGVPEMLWGETLDEVVTRSDKAAKRLRRLGVGARVQLTRRAREFGVSPRGGQRGGVIAGFGNHHWIVRVKPDGHVTARPYHARFWEPEPKRQKKPLP